MQIGSPSDVYLHPATPFVAGFLGETNLLPGDCRGFEGDNVVIKFRNGEIGRARIPRFGGRPAAGDPVLTSIRPERMRILQAAMRRPTPSSKARSSAVPSSAGMPATWSTPRGSRSS